MALAGTGKFGVQGMGGIGKTVLAAALAHDSEVRQAFPDGIYWLTIGQKPNLLDLQNQLLRQLTGTGAVIAVAITPNGRPAVSGSGDRTLRVWDLESGEAIATFTGENGMCSCAIAPDRQTIITGDTAGRVHFLRIVEADEKKSPMGDTRIPPLHREEQTTSVTDS
jgi:WD40 repeat protein